MSLRKLNVHALVQFSTFLSNHVASYFPYDLHLRILMHLKKTKSETRSGLKSGTNIANLSRFTLS